MTVVHCDVLVLGRRVIKDVVDYVRQLRLSFGGVAGAHRRGQIEIERHACSCRWDRAAIILNNENPVGRSTRGSTALPRAQQHAVRRKTR